MLKLRTLVWGAVVLGVALYFGDPVPSGFSEPVRLKLLLSSSRHGFRFLRLLDMLRIHSYEKSVRFFFDNYVARESLNRRSDITAREDYFDGVRVRVYKPNHWPKEGNIDKDSYRYPTLVYYHGGGFFAGTTDTYEPFLTDLAADTGVLVVSVDYRRSPEHIFPVALDDCVTVTKYVLSHADTLTVDPARVAIAGDSAGGNLAAAVALRLRDDAFTPRPSHQLLLYPCLQASDFSLPSHVQNSHGPLISGHIMALAWSLYAVGSANYTHAILNNRHTTSQVKHQLANSYLRHQDLPEEFFYDPYKTPDQDHGDPETWRHLEPILMNLYFAPLMAADLSGLPDAYIYTAHYDLLRDEGFLYGKRLREAGVEVSYTDAASAFHGVCLERHFKEGQECYQGIRDYIRQHL